MILKIGKYEHFKGKQYEVLGVAKHSENLEEFVVYKALYGDGDLWIRPVKMFLEKVEVGDKRVPRFNYIGK
jgi:cyclomaltodextrinase